MESPFKDPGLHGDVRPCEGPRLHRLPQHFIILVTSDQALKDLHGTVEPDFASEASMNRLTPSCTGTAKYET